MAAPESCTIPGYPLPEPAKTPCKIARSEIDAIAVRDLDQLFEGDVILMFEGDVNREFRFKRFGTNQDLSCWSFQTHGARGHVQPLIC